MVSLYNEDCLTVMKKIKENSIDLIMTDPPYGVGFSKGFDDSKEHVTECVRLWLSEMYRILKDGSHCYIFVPIKEIDLWVSAVKNVGFNFMNLLSTRAYTSSIYLKNNYSFNNQLVIYCSKNKAKRLNHVDFIKTSDSWLHDKRNKNPHEYINKEYFCAAKSRIEKAESKEGD